MATGYIYLPIPGGYPPETGVAESVLIGSGGSAPSNGPILRVAALRFSATVDQHWFWSGLMPFDYVSGGLIRFAWASYATALEVVWKASAVGAIPSSDDLDSLSLGTVQTTSALTVPSTSLVTSVDTVNTSTTGLAANRMFQLMFGRDADAAGDDAANKSVLLAANFEYQTT